MKKKMICTLALLSIGFASTAAVVVESSNQELETEDFYETTIAGCKFRCSFWGTFQIDRFGNPELPFAMITDPQGSFLHELSIGDAIDNTASYLTDNHPNGAISALHGNPFDGGGSPGQSYYFGFKAFQIGSTNPYFGWVKVTYTDHSVIVDEIGINDVANEPITVGQSDIAGLGTIQPVSFEVFPNPTVDFIQIRDNHDLPVQRADIYSQHGQLVRSISFSTYESDKDIDVSELKKGIYFLSVVFDDGTYGKQLFVKVDE